MSDVVIYHSWKKTVEELEEKRKTKEKEEE